MFFVVVTVFGVCVCVPTHFERTNLILKIFDIFN